MPQEGRDQGPLPGRLPCAQTARHAQPQPWNPAPSTRQRAESCLLSLGLSGCLPPPLPLALALALSRSLPRLPRLSVQVRRSRGIEAGGCDTTQQSGISHRSFRRNSTPPVATGKGVKASESGGCPGGRSPVLRCTGKLTRPAEVPKPALKAHQGPCRLPLLPKSASPGAAAQLAMAGNVSGWRFCPATR